MEDKFENSHMPSEDKFKNPHMLPTLSYWHILVNYAVGGPKPSFLSALTPWISCFSVQLLMYPFGVTVRPERTKTCPEIT